MKEEVMCVERRVSPEDVLMLEVRPDQIKAFRDDAERKYVTKLCGVLPSIWPGLCITLGDKGLREWVEKGLAKAKDYGIETIANRTRYVHLMCMLVNPDFDTDPKTAWAGTILGWKAPEGLKLAALEKRARLEAEKATE